MKYLKLIRYQNLLLLAFMQLAFRYGFMIYQNPIVALSDFQYILLVLSTILIAAGGYIINNIFDQYSDMINKPQNVVVGKSVSETMAYNIYIGVTLIGVSLGFYISNVVNKPGLASFFILTAALLYYYATTLKQIILLGNIVVALLLSFSVIIIGVFDLLPIMTFENQSEIRGLFSVLLHFSIFAFIINLLRELVKDAEDVNGDYNQGIKTLPIVLGVERTGKLVTILAFLPFVILLWYIKKYFIASRLFLVSIYAFLTILAPILYIAVKAWNAKTKKDFHHLSTVLKIILFFGILGILVISINTQIK